MTGLEKIISQIEQEAQDAAAVVLEKADAQCTQITVQAEAACADIRAEAEANAKLLRTDLLARGDSGAQMQRKNRILSAKQDMIQSVIEKAKEALMGQQSIDYFVMLSKLAASYTQPGDGVMYLSAADLARVPAYFPGKLQELAKAKGGTMVLSDQPVDISGGFVLAYGGIEENCSFEALLESQKEHLQDIVRTQLFS